ncbi:MAG: MFS transporter [Simkaniaceae bacterium]|nr:MFS transporter [Simkaniaceae bacterium]
MIRIKTTLPILVVLFLSYFGYSMGLPLYPALLFDPDKGMLVSSYPQWLRSVLIGFLSAMYPLGQFFGGPLLGKLSDKYGRRNVLLYSLILIIPTYMISAFAINMKNILLFFLGRLTCGLFEGIVVIGTAAMADISDNHKDKVKNFGWLITISSTGYIFGPIVGGLLADSETASWFTYSTPFWLGAWLTVLAWFIVYFLFEESLKTFVTKRIDIPDMLFSLYKPLTRPNLKNVFFANFNLFLCIFFFFSFFPLLLMTQYDFNVTLLGEATGYLSIPICIAPLFFPYLSKHFSPRQIAALAGLILGVFILIILGLDNSMLLFITLLPPGFAIGVSFSYSALMVSDRVAENVQGESLGANQSVLVFAEIVAGVVGGFLAATWVKLPMIIGALTAIFAAVWLIWKVLDPPSSQPDRPFPE